MSPKSKRFKNTIIIVTFAILLYWVLENYTVLFSLIGNIKGILAPFIWGACIAFILNLPMSAIEKNLFKERVRQKPKTKKLIQKFKRPASLLITLIIFFGIILSVCFLVIPEVINTFNTLKDSMPTFIKTTNNLINKFSASIPAITEQINKFNIDLEKIMNTIIEYFQTTAGNLLSSTLNIATSFFSGLFKIVLGLIFAVYILVNKEKLAGQSTRIISAYIPKKYADKFLYIANMSYDIFSKFLGGQCTEALILGTLCFVGMSILKLPYALVVSLLIAITAFIPIVGAFIGAIVGAFLILVTSPIKALWFIIFLLALQQVEGNLIYPKVVGSSIGLPSMWVLFAVTVGGSIGGILGMFIGVPIASILYSLFREHVNHKNNIST